MDRILAFGCHPDDVEFQVAGTLALLGEQGFEIHIAVMAGGEVGSTTVDPQQLRELRLRECAQSAAKVDGHFHYTGGYDLDVQYDDRYRRMTVRIVREVDPLIILAPPPMDYVIDHEETSRLVRNAAYIASVPHFDCGVPTKPTGRIPYLYYCNAMGRCDIFGRALPLHFIVDITSVLKLKRDMLACHDSQRQWLKFLNGMDNYLVNMEHDAREQGRLINCAYGEGFIQHLGYGHPKDNILKNILGDRCVAL